MSIINLKATSPSGKIYIGDPCYVMKRDLYDKLFDKMNWDAPGGCSIETEVLPGVFACAGTTRHGDGWYETGSVDSGTIGAVPIEACDQDKLFPKKEPGKSSFPIEYIVWDTNEVNLEYGTDSCQFFFCSDFDNIVVDTDEGAYEDLDEAIEEKSRVQEAHLKKVNEARVTTIPKLNLESDVVIALLEVLKYNKELLKKVERIGRDFFKGGRKSDLVKVLSSFIIEKRIIDEDVVSEAHQLLSSPFKRQFGEIIMFNSFDVVLSKIAFIFAWGIMFELEENPTDNVFSQRSTTLFDDAYYYAVERGKEKFGTIMSRKNEVWKDLDEAIEEKRSLRRFRENNFVKAEYYDVNNKKFKLALKDDDRVLEFNLGRQVFEFKKSQLFSFLSTLKDAFKTMKD